tara:strand:- start:4235 stop:6541 length:2307 start_codon:yes stop_codon:yes gene_type:complete
MNQSSNKGWFNDLLRMTKLKYLLISLCSLLTSSCALESPGSFNLDFERLDTKKNMAHGWFRGSDYPISLDEDSHSGRYAGKITSNGSGVEGRIVYPLPANYKGTAIQLEGFIRTKDVEEGFAGLLMKIEGKKTRQVNGRRIEESGFMLDFENMGDQGITGTTNWKRYKIELPFKDGAELITVGGILSGKGEAWFDDLVVSIDGKDIRSLKTNGEIGQKVKMDREFDMGSNIEFPKLEEKLVANLELLGKVWGFLKYHHPRVAKGNYNWDYELFRVLPDYLAVKHRSQRDDILVNWISGFGELKECESCESSFSSAFLKPDISWIRKGDMSTKLKGHLMSVYNNRNQGENFYVEMDGNVGNPKFTNENPYTMMPFPDKGFRLLALYRYWNMIQYFFPYRHLTDKDWNRVLKEYIPLFIDGKSELEYELATVQLVGEVKDTHANLWSGANKLNALRGTYYPPFRTRFVENKLVITEHLYSQFLGRSSLSIGDIITHINGRPIESIIDSVQPYYPASNDAARKRDMARDLLRSDSRTVTVDYISRDESGQVEIKLYEKHDLNYIDDFRNDGRASFKLLEQNVGYITLRSLKKEEIESIMELFKYTKGIIIDIRNYPNTFVPFTLAPYFVSSATPFVKFTKGKINQPGAFSFTETLEVPKGPYYYKGKLVVLVNQLSQSQSEYTSMAFKAGDNVTIIGGTTAGADGNVSNIYLPGGLKTSISGIGVYYPNGTETQRVGIVPDTEVKPTIKGIREGKDELLEKAIEIILIDSR